MSAPTWMTVAEYAAHRGCSDSYVRRMRRLGRLVVDDKGRIDRDASDARLAAEDDPLRGGDRTRPADAARAEEARDGGAGAEPAPMAVVALGGVSLREAMRRERLAKARAAELALGEATRQLTRTRDAERAVFTLARHALERLRGMKSRLRTSLAAESDPRRIEDLLDGEIREICADMQQAAVTLFAAMPAVVEVDE